MTDLGGIHAELSEFSKVHNFLSRSVDLNIIECNKPNNISMHLVHIQYGSIVHCK